MDVTVCLSTPCSLSPHLSEAGSSQPGSLPAALADAQCRGLSTVGVRSWGLLEQETGHGTMGHGMLKDTLGCAQLSGFSLPTA